jgi:hypothetical protein
MFPATLQHAQSPVASRMVEVYSGVHPATNPMQSWPESKRGALH